MILRIHLYRSKIKIKISQIKVRHYISILI